MKPFRNWESTAQYMLGVTLVAFSSNQLLGLAIVIWASALQISYKEPK